MLAATASITHDDAYQAGRDLAAELIDGLGSSPDVVLLFAAPRYEPRAVLAGLHRRLKPTVALLGCSSFAEIDRAEALSGSVTALGLRGDELDAHVLCATSECGDDLGNLGMTSSDRTFQVVHQRDRTVRPADVEEDTGGDFR